jgi:hypothetical protein
MSAPSWQLVNTSVQYGFAIALLVRRQEHSAQVTSRFMMEECCRSRKSRGELVADDAHELRPGSDECISTAERPEPVFLSLLGNMEQCERYLEHYSACFRVVAARTSSASRG